MLRLFVGTFLSRQDQEMLGVLESSNQDLRDKWSRKLGWVQPENLHLTWLFLGDVKSGAVERIKEELEQAVIRVRQQEKSHGSPEDLSIEYDHLELWPDARHARLAVLASSAVSEEIPRLADSITQRLFRFVRKKVRKGDKGRFKPHVTVMRIRGYRSTSRMTTTPSCDDIGGLEPILPICQRIDRVSLIASDLSKGRAIYEEIARIPV